MAGRQLAGALALVAAAALAVVLLAWLAQRRLIYLPRTGPVPPAAAVLPGAEDVTFRTEDGLVLEGWFMPADGGAPTATVLVCNGNAGDRVFRAPLAAALADGGVSVLLFDYRGYGNNPGNPSEGGLLADARAARGYLAGRDDVDPARLVYYGESLGTGVAVALAVEQPPMALVLRSPFPDLAAVGRLHYPYLPVRALLRDRFAVTDRIGRVHAPVLVVAGERDRIVPPDLSRRVHAAANAPKRFLLVPAAGHNDPALLAGALVVNELLSFLREVSGAQ